MIESIQNLAIFAFGSGFVIAWLSGSERFSLYLMGGGFVLLGIASALKDLPAFI